MFLLPFLVAFVSCNAPPVPTDDIIIEKTFTPEQCQRAVKDGDYVRYHYNGMFPDGKKFDSRWENLSFPDTILTFIPRFSTHSHPNHNHD